MAPIQISHYRAIRLAPIRPAQSERDHQRKTVAEVIPAAILLKLASWGVPEGLRKPIAVLGAIALVLGLLWGAKAIYDASVIEDHENERAIESIEARDTSAEERAFDAIQGIIADKDRVEVVEEAAAVESAKPVEQRAKLPPTTRALNCKRMQQAFTAKELAKMPAYQRECKP